MFYLPIFLFTLKILLSFLKLTDNFDWLWSTTLYIELSLWGGIRPLDCTLKEIEADDVDHLKNPVQYIHQIIRDQNIKKSGGQNHSLIFSGTPWKNN